MILFRLIIILLCTLSMGACKEDFSYPNVFTELAEVKTDAKGKLVYLTTDNGETFSVKANKDTTTFAPDTLYRIISVYEKLEEDKNELLLHTAKPIIAPVPIPIESIKNGVKTDPVDIQSIWKTEKYLNMILHVQTKNKPHTFHFVDQGIHPYKKEKHQQVLEFVLYHDRGDDYEAFTTKFYFSIPLYPYKDLMKKGDIIRLHIHTYKEGTTIREYEF